MKMKIGLLFAAVVFYSSGVQLHAENGEESPLTFRHGVGFAAGFVTGYGLSYRRYLNNLALQFTFAPYIRGDEARISMGIAVMRTVYKGKKSGLFVYSGIHYLYDNSIIYYDQQGVEMMKNDMNMNSLTERRIEEKNLNLGFGPGLEIRITENIVFNVMAGYALYMTSIGASSISFTGETALFYCF